MSAGHFACSACACCGVSLAKGSSPLSPKPRRSSVSTLIPVATNWSARPSQIFRWRLHWCSNSTPGPGLAAAKKDTLSLIPSAAVRSVTLGACGSAAEHVNAMDRVATRVNRRVFFIDAPKVSYLDGGRSDSSPLNNRVYAEVRRWRKSVAAIRCRAYRLRIDLAELTP